jgi:hypothetical protein
MTRKKRNNKKPSTPAKKAWVEQNLPGKGGSGGKGTPTSQAKPQTPPKPQPKVLLAQTITWAPGKSALVYGETLTAEHLNATALGGATPVYKDASNAVVAMGAKLAAGSHVISVSAAATDTHAASTAPLNHTFTVAKAAPKLSWKTPAAVNLAGTPPSFKLTKTQLNASVDEGESTLAYTPALGASLTNGTHFLRAVHAASANYLRGETSVRLLVYRSASTLKGFETIREGKGWKPGKGLPTAVQKRWEDDEGQVQTQGKQLMQSMQDLTVEEMKDFLDKQVANKSTDYVYQGGKYPNQMWKFPNGLQVRVKPDGDAFSSEPKFCIEVVSEAVRTSGGFTSKNDKTGVVCKLSIDGSPAPKGPGDTDLDGIGNETATDNYVLGSCQATHPVCRTKLAPKLNWTAPAPIMVGTRLEAGVQLNATVEEGEGTLVYDPEAGMSPNNPGVFTLTATLPASKRYREGSISVKITVNPAPPKTPAQKTTPVKKK